MSYAVIVWFAVKPEALAPFMNLVQDNARQSVATELGCLRFDVVETETPETSIPPYLLRQV